MGDSGPSGNPGGPLSLCVVPFPLGVNQDPQEEFIVHRLVFAFVVVLMVAASATLAGGAFAAAPPSKDTFTMREFAFDTTSDIVKAGNVTITVKNTGNTVHNLVFTTIKLKTPFIQPGKTFKLVAKLKPGSYPYVCTLPRHAENGMQGVLVVKK